MIAGRTSPGHANPFRGDKFAEGWAPAAEAVLDYGATAWGFYRAIDGRLDFIQDGGLPDQGALRALLVLGARSRRRGPSCRATIQVPVLPTLYEIVGERPRPAQPCSSGAIVSPRPLSCSQ